MSRKEGLQFKGRSSDAGKRALHAAMEVVDPHLADGINRIKNWRNDYASPFIQQVQMAARGQRQAHSIAAAGLAELYQNFHFRHGGRSLPLLQALEEVKVVPLHEFTIEGRGRAVPLTVPYKGRDLDIKALVAQMRTWATVGTVEPSSLAAIQSLQAHPEWLQLSARDSVFVLMGAGSAMGPLKTLLSLGAHVVAVDLNGRPAMWKRMIAMAQDSAGVLTVPSLYDIPAEATLDDLSRLAGVNLLQHTPDLARWLSDLPHERMCIGAYAYADGALHVQLTVAMDAVQTHVSEVRRARDQSTDLSFLLSPTDVFSVPEAVREASLSAYNQWDVSCVWKAPLKAASGGNWMVCNQLLEPVKGHDGRIRAFSNGIVSQQGPNYLMAKRLQQWRCIVARVQGQVVSANVAPASATQSVMHNKLLKAAYGGTHHFPPVEIFEPDTSNALMTALLLHDLHNPNSTAQPSTQLSNPLDLFSDGAVHGGVWRCPYQLSSVSVVAAVLYWGSKYSFHVVLGTTAAAAAASEVMSKL